MKQGACLRHVWRLLARKGLNCLLLAVLSALALPAQARNHFIVLFDASGTMKKQDGGPENPFWRGNIRDSQNMAEVLSLFIHKIVKDTPEGFESFKPGEDIFSFLMFVADWDNPNFAPEELFYTHKNLLARSDKLPTSKDYKSFNILPESAAAETSRVSLASVFSGHSPIIASTNLSMSFIADRMRQQNRQDEFDQVVDKIFIIRVSDGQYNARSNGFDEHNLVQSTAVEIRREKGSTTDVSEEAQKGFERYKDISGRVTRVFDIGAREAQCAFSTPNRNYILKQPLDCSSAAYARVDTWGTGLLINYLKVEPKAPGIATLARTEATRAQLQMGYRPEDSGQANAGVRLTGENKIRVDSSSGNDSHFKLLPKESMALQASIDGGNNWRECSLEDGFGDCGNAGPKFDFSLADLPGVIRYRANYVLELSQKEDETALYPYRIRLETLELPEVRLVKAQTRDSIYELPRDPNDTHCRLDYITHHCLDYIHPRRLPGLFSGAAPQYPVRGIDAETLAEKAEAWLSDIKPRLPDWEKDWGLEDTGLILPRMIARVSEEKKTELIGQEKHISTVLFWLFFIFLLCINPRRKLYAELVLNKDPVVLDFNHHEYNRMFPVGSVNIKNEKSNFGYRFGFEKIEAQLSFPGEDSDKSKGLKLKNRPAAPFAISRPGKHLLKEKEIPSQKDILVFFDPRELEDLEHPPESDPAAKLKLSLPVRVDLATGSRSSKECKALSASLPLQILPERGRLHIDTPEQFTGAEVGDGRPVIEVDFESGQRVEVCCYRLHNSAQHRYSHRVRGELKVEIIQTDDEENQDGPKPPAVLLSDGQSTGPDIAFDLGYKEDRKFTVLADCKQLENPHTFEDYQIEVSEQHTDDADTNAKPVWKPVELWTLRLKRSTERTDVSMQVIQDNNNCSMELRSDRTEGAFEVGSRAKPVNVVPFPSEPKDSRNFPPLFKVRLANSCRDGRGQAQWEFTIKQEKPTDVIINGDAILVTSGHWQEKIGHSGQLQDSTVDTEREKALHIQLDFSKVKPGEQDFQISFTVTVEWQVYEDGSDNNAQPQVFKTTMSVCCYLRHQPIKEVLAIDFGTSAVAIAYAAGSKKDARLLALNVPLLELHEKESRRLDDPDNKNSSYLASMVNVNIEPDKLENIDPSEADFLDLPMKNTALYQCSELCFSSIKSLISAGHTTLPLPNNRVVYKDKEGNQTGSAPPLEEVLVGAYKGLLDNFVKPILSPRNQGYSYVRVTHPNTYTNNHVKKLREILNEVFLTVPLDERNNVYRKNIDFMSESDAVAYYYLLRAQQWRKNGAQPPSREHILVYDIGAGTLDLTYLAIDWKDENGVCSPNKETSPGVLRRDGVTRAGDLLDECIARDLHRLLSEELDSWNYLTPIVVNNKSDRMEPKEIQLMDELRKQIQTLKRDLSQNKQALSLKLTGWSSDELKLVKADLSEECRTLYSACKHLRRSDSGDVFWDTNRQQIEEGEFVKGFLDQVTRRELELFFRDGIPDIDTLIISGRTSLWPGFEEKLLSTLKRNPGNINIIEFNRDSDELKRAVVMGALEKKYVWTDFKLKEPDSVGDFGVCYQSSPAPNAPMIFHKHKKLGDFQKTDDLTNASDMEIGLRTNNGFKICYAFQADTYMTEGNKLLDIKLEQSEEGFLKATIKNSSGTEQLLQTPKLIPTLTSPQQPWPLGAVKLEQKTPDELFETKYELD